MLLHTHTRTGYEFRMVLSSLGISFPLPSIFIIHEFTSACRREPLRKRGVMDTRRGANRASVYTQEDFNDLSSGIRRMTIDTRFHLDRSGRFGLGCIRSACLEDTSFLRASCYLVQNRFERLSSLNVQQLFAEFAFGACPMHLASDALYSAKLFFISCSSGQLS